MLRGPSKYDLQGPANTRAYLPRESEIWDPQASLCTSLAFAEQDLEVVFLCPTLCWPGHSWPLLRFLRLEVDVSVDRFW